MVWVVKKCILRWLACTDRWWNNTILLFSFFFFFFYHNKRKKFGVYGVVRLTSQRSLYSPWLRKFKSTFRNAMQLKLLITVYSKPLFFCNRVVFIYISGLRCLRVCKNWNQGTASIDHTSGGIFLS